MTTMMHDVLYDIRRALTDDRSAIFAAMNAEPRNTFESAMSMLAYSSASVKRNPPMSDNDRERVRAIIRELEATIEKGNVK